MFVRHNSIKNAISAQISCRVPAKTSLFLHSGFTPNFLWCIKSKIETCHVIDLAERERMQFLPNLQKELQNCLSRIVILATNFSYISRLSGSQPHLWIPAPSLDLSPISGSQPHLSISASPLLGSHLLPLAWDLTLMLDFI